MEEQRLLFVKLLIFLAGYSSAERCDRSTTARVQEGNFGQSGVFNWLGVLSVHLHEEDITRIAMTGLVLIKMKHAIANADDVVKIPQSIFKSDSTAMFFPAPDTPWYVKPDSYVAHPEYESSTLNTIAIIELNLDEVNDFPLNPICLPSGDRYNTSRYLYLTGYTDENQKIEKVIYKIQYLEKRVCEEFYNRAGLSSQKRVPSVYVCGYAPSNVTQCVWDNGMALVSNATGYFHLIGFGIHGPGCAAPARFIDLFQYYYWINTVIEPDEIYDSYRRNDDEFVPIHDLFITNDTRRQGPFPNHTFDPYPFDPEILKHYMIKPQDDKNNILIYPFNEKWEQFEDACNKSKALMYREIFKLTTRHNATGTMTYKLSLFDLDNALASCVHLKVDCDEKSDAILTFREVIDYREGTQLTEQTDDTPEEIITIFTGANTKKRPKQNESRVPNPRNYNIKVLNYDLYIELKFTDQVVMNFEIYAVPGPLTGNRSLYLTTQRTTTKQRPTTTPPKKKPRLRVHKPEPKPVWGGATWVDKMLREDGAKFVPDVEEVQEIESAAWSEGARGAVVTACGLISACLRRVLFIN